MEPEVQKNEFPLTDINAPSPISTEKVESENKIPAIRTYSSDLAEALREQKGSMVKIAVQEDQKRRDRLEANSPTTTKNISLMAASFVMLGIAVVAVLGVLYYRNRQLAAVQPIQVQSPNSFIRTEQYAVLDITGQSRDQIIATLRGADITDGSNIGVMKNFFITETAGTATRIPAANFLASLSTHAPSDFTRALDKEYMFGAYLYDHTNKFLILRGSAHDYMQSGLLAWEPEMLSDLGPLFGIDTTGKNAGLLTTTFTDVVVRNQNVRAVIGPDGTPAIFYSFLDQDTVLIAADPNTLVEVVRRFTSN